jgi:4-amino-4-deoxy-L-arabinose transferase-like glycosyltransferase
MTAGHASGHRLSYAARIAAWYDREADDGRAVWILLALFVLIWTVFQIVTLAPLCLHDDMLELFAWSRHPSAGSLYGKHPPLAPLIVAAWFAAFPAANWSFELLAAVNAAVGLFAVDLIARRYVAGDRRVLVLLLLLLTPFYQFHSQKFNANAILLSTWPIATYCFLRAFESRRIGWAVAAGVTAALAMLGKYYSAYLIAGFIVAALCHPRRGDYLRSPSPWVSILSGFAVLAPHLYWLATTSAAPLGYVLKHAANSALQELTKTLAYAAGAIGYVLLPIAAYLLAVRPDRPLLTATLWPEDPDRRMLVLLLAVPLVLPMLTAPLIGVVLTPLWTMSAWFLLPIILLAPAQIPVTRAVTMRVALAVVIITAVVFAAAPLVAWRNFAAEAKDGRACCRVAVDELTKAWHAAMQRPLSLVAGDSALSQGASFYSPDHPDSAPDYLWETPAWITDDRRAREGWAIACFANDRACLDAAMQNTAGRSGVVRVEKEVTASFFGVTSTSAKVVFTMVPPQR